MSMHPLLKNLNQVKKDLQSVYILILAIGGTTMQSLCIAHIGTGTWEQVTGAGQDSGKAQENLF